MDINSKDMLNSILKKISSIDYVKPEDIPNIDLYMDQVTTFMDRQMRSTKRYENDKVLTKTMINNYAKNNLLPPPIKKKYSKEHILQMLLIYRLKQTLSIHQIMGVMQKLGAQAEDEQVWESLYAGYLDSRESNGELLSEMLKTLLEKNPADTEESAAQLLLQLSWVSYMTKRMCDELVAKVFPLEEKEKKKEKS